MRNLIITIVAAIVVIVVVLLLTKKSEAKTTDEKPDSDFISNGGQGEVRSNDPIIDVIEDSTPIRSENCRKDCRMLCGAIKMKPVLGIISMGLLDRKRTECKKKCKSDCVKGVNIFSKYP